MTDFNLLIVTAEGDRWTLHDTEDGLRLTWTNGPGPKPIDYSCDGVTLDVGKPLTWHEGKQVLSAGEIVSVRRLSDPRPDPATYLTLRADELPKKHSAARDALNVIAQMHDYDEAAPNACLTCEFDPWPCPTLLHVVGAWHGSKDWNPEWTPKDWTS